MDFPRKRERSAPRDRKIGLISDTHGLIRPEALEALAGWDPILHAGDIGSPEVLAALDQLAPTFAIRGNNDIGAWASELPWNAIAVVESARAKRPHQIYLIHDFNEIPRGQAGSVLEICKTNRPFESSFRER